MSFQFIQPAGQTRIDLPVPDGHHETTDQRLIDLIGQDDISLYLFCNTGTKSLQIGSREWGSRGYLCMDNAFYFIVLTDKLQRSGIHQFATAFSNHDIEKSQNLRSNFVFEQSSQYFKL